MPSLEFWFRHQHEKERQKIVFTSVFPGVFGKLPIFRSTNLKAPRYWNESELARWLECRGLPPCIARSFEDDLKMASFSGVK